MNTKSILLFAALFGSSIARPTLSVPDVAGASRVCANVILAAAPNSAKCDSTAQFADECRTAEQAAPFVTQSFIDYDMATAGEQAALLAWMLYETGEFKYNKSHFPTPTEGKGTRDLMSPDFVKKYATALFGADKVAQAGTPAAILDLVAGDRESFASAAWFVSSQCDQSIRQSLQAGTQAGWTAFLTKCVYTTDNSDRDAYWTKTMTAMGALKN